MAMQVLTKGLAQVQGALLQYMDPRLLKQAPCRALFEEPSATTSYSLTQQHVAHAAPW